MTDTTRTRPAERVVVVDDHATFRGYAALVLERAGYVVCGEAASAAEAREVIARTDPDVALIDIDLGDGADGIDLAEQVADDTRIVLTSSRTAAALGSRVARSGHRFVPKERVSGSVLRDVLADDA